MLFSLAEEKSIVKWIVALDDKAALKFCMATTSYSALNNSADRKSPQRQRQFKNWILWSVLIASIEILISKSNATFSC